MTEIIALIPRRNRFGPALLLAALLGAAFVPHRFFFGATDWEKVYIPAELV